MTPTKLLIGQILIVFAIVIGALWGATQWAAGQLDFQAGLGSAWFKIAGYQIHLPWRLFQWWYAYEAYAPSVFNRAGAVAASGGILGVIVAIAGSLWRARQSRLVTTYGSSRLADNADVNRSRLVETAGVFLGTFKRNYLRHDGSEHVMCFAPTRSGKGVELVMPDGPLSPRNFRRLVNASRACCRRSRRRRVLPFANRWACFIGCRITSTGR